MGAAADTDVIVAGAGPAGLMLAGELRLRGVRTVVLERQLERDERLRAEGITSLTVDALDRHGLLDRLREHLHVDGDARTGRPRGAMSDPANSARPATASPADLPPADRPAATAAEWLGVRQQLVERVLEERAIELGADVQRGREVVGLRQDASGATVEVRGPTGEPSAVRAAYVVGCDGGRSAVRRYAEIPSSGTDPTITGYQALVTVVAPERPWALQPGWHRTPTGIAAWAPGPGRVVSIEFDGPPADRHAPVTLAEVQASLRRTSGMDVTLAEPRSMARFSDNTRLVDRYRVGRVLLAGDAAHVHPPFGGQGLSLSLLDAVNLGWKLAATVQGWAPTALLDTYHSERRPVAARVLRNALADVALLDPDERMTPAFELFGEIKALEQVRPHLLELISTALMRYDTGVPDEQAHPLLGRAVPDLTLQTSQGLTRLIQLQRSGRGLLLDLDGRSDACDAVANWSDRVDVVRARCRERDDVSALLVRPDGYAAWVAPTGEAHQPGPLDGALYRWFGRPSGRRSSGTRTLGGAGVIGQSVPRGRPRRQCHHTPGTSGTGGCEPSVERSGA